MSGEVRQFETGATRDTDTGKLAFEGFLSPVVLLRFAQYMHKHRIQSDGQLRDPDNWQKGIPYDAYMDSLLRHIVDIWLHHDGDGDLAREPLEEALCACMFNIQGMLYEILQGRHESCMPSCVDEPTPYIPGYSGASFSE